MKLSKKAIKGLTEKNYSYFKMDDALDNFGVKVYPSGKKSFIVRIRFTGGSIKTYTVGDVTKLSIAEGRKQAGEIIDKYKSGVDVRVEEKQKQDGNKTLTECLDGYFNEVKQGTHKSLREAKLIWDKHGWLNKPLRNITEGMVLKLYDKRVKMSFHGARQEAAYLRAIWNQNKKGLQLGDSPTLILNEERKGWNKKTVKHRRLDFETAANWYQAIQTLNFRDQHLFLLIYYTGLRAKEAMTLEWDNINFTNRSLHITETKNGRPLDIPLNSYAIDILNEINDSEHKHNRYIFPATNADGKVEPMKYYSKQLGKLKKQGVEWSPHDSRRGFITAAERIGVSTYMSKQLTGHVIETEIHGGYVHFTIGELRTGSQRIGDALNKQLNAVNVIQFKQIA